MASQCIPSSGFDRVGNVLVPIDLTAMAMQVAAAGIAAVVGSSPLDGHSGVAAGSVNDGKFGSVCLQLVMKPVQNSASS